MSEPSAEKKGALTSEAFTRLLRWLDPDRERAGEKYEMIRRKLTKFFEWRGDGFAEEHADETVNRVAGRIAGGELVRTGDPYSYFCGVARLLFLEVLREREREQAALAHISFRPPAHPDDEQERQLGCLEQCLQKLPAESRALILQYHQGEKRTKIENRRALAEQLQIPLNALRIRAHRIREQLETCLDHCLKS